VVLSAIIYAAVAWYSDTVLMMRWAMKSAWLITSNPRNALRYLQVIL